MHKLECSAMCSYGENWCPSETVRLVARIIMKQVTTAVADNFAHEATSQYIDRHFLGLASQVNVFTLIDCHWEKVQNEIS